MDLAFFRANFDQIAERLATRGNRSQSGQVSASSTGSAGAAITEAEELKAQKNAASDEIGKLRQQRRRHHRAAAARSRADRRSGSPGSTSR